jgi:phenylalanyl-tRNA synthetase alpha chain
MSAVTTLTAEQARAALLLRDLTDPEQGPHAMQRLVADVENALQDGWGTPVVRRRANPVVPVTDNYDRLRYPRDAAARDARYTRYLTRELMLRSHTSAAIPSALESLPGALNDVAVSCPGLVYRRDAIDRVHVGEPHQLDLWRVRRDPIALSDDDLDAMVDTIVRAALPGARWRANPAEHPYTLDGREIEVATPDGWVEVGECGLAHPEVLAGCGLAGATGLASGWGLDRLLMLRKGIDDIRLLRSDDPRVANQMLDLEPYSAVSVMPAAVRDVSIAVDESVDAELIGDRVREALADDARVVEEVEVLSTTPGTELPESARARLGLQPGQHNLLLRLVLRDLEHTMTTAEANRLRDRIYAAIHEGTVHTWATR